MEENRASKKKVKFGGFNILDILIVFFVLATVLILLFRGEIIDSLRTSMGETQIEFVVRTNSVREISCLAVNVGDNFYDKEGGAYLGEVTEVSYRPAKKEVTMADGTIVLTDDPMYFTLHITVRGTGESKPEGFFINATRIVSPGANIIYETSLLSSTGHVVRAIEVVDQ